MTAYKIHDKLQKKINEYESLKKEILNNHLYNQNDLENRIYHFLTIDKNALNSFKQNPELNNKLSDVYIKFNNFIKNELQKDYLGNNGYWVFFGKKDKSGNYKLKAEKLRIFKNRDKFDEPTIGFKYYLKVDYDSLLSDPDSVIEFYRDVIKKGYENNEVYQYKMPISFSEFIGRKDGFVLYLNKNKINNFLKRVKDAKNRHKLNNKVRAVQGFDVALKTGESYSYTELISQEIANEIKNNLLTLDKEKIAKQGDAFTNELGKLVYSSYNNKYHLN